MPLKLGHSSNHHLKYQSSYNWPISLTGHNEEATVDFDLCQYGHISQEDIEFRIRYLDNESDKSLGAFKRIELYYCNECIGKRLYYLDKVISKTGIFKLKDVFPGIRFNVYNNPTNKLVVRFQRSNKPYKFEEFSVEYNKNFDKLEDIIRFEDSIVSKEQVYYHLNSGELVLVQAQFNDGLLHNIEDTPFKLYLNDEEIMPPYPYEAFTMPGKHYIKLDKPEDIKDYVYIQKFIK